MFCQKCGAQINDDAVFCSSCGAQLNDFSQKSSNNPSDNSRINTRNQEIEETKKLMEYFSNPDIVSLYEKQQNLFAERNLVSNTSPINNIIKIGLAVMVVSFTPLFLNIGNIGLVFFAVLFVTGIILLFKGTQILNVCKRQNEEKINEIDIKLTQVDEEVNKYYTNYENCPVGIQYTNMYDLNIIYETLLSGRADTIKEAINIIIDDSRQDRMENIATQTAKYTQQASVNAGKAAKAAKVGAVFSAANFLQNRKNKK